MTAAPGAFPSGEHRPGRNAGDRVRRPAGLPPAVPGVESWRSVELETMAERAGCLVVLCDGNGLVRLVVGAADLRRRAADSGLGVGVNLVVPAAGTNAVSLAWREGRTGRVDGGEHTCPDLGHWCAEASPLWADANGPPAAPAAVTPAGPAAAPAAVTPAAPAAGPMLAVASVWWDAGSGPVPAGRDDLLAAGELAARANVEAARARWLLEMLETETEPACGHLVADVNGHLRLVTAAARRILGLTEGERDLSRALPFLWQQIMAPPTGPGPTCLALRPPAVPAACDVTVAAMPGEPDLRQMTVALRQGRQPARGGSAARYRLEDIITASPGMAAALDLARQAAATPAPVLLLGESGTGKELVAQAIHLASARSHGPFVAVNCAAFPRDLIVSELFGHEDGAFTGARRQGAPGRFEQAGGGTLFLDEIAEMAPEHQGVLLRVLEDGHVVRLGSGSPRRVDVRIVAATNRDLQLDVAQGRFRADLYYRLNVVPIHLPALRDRPEDIPVLATRFLERETRNLGKRLTWSGAAMERLCRYPWPGNVRELHNVVKRTAILVADGTVGPDLLPELSASEPLPAAGGTPVRSARRVPEPDIARALADAAGNISAAARRLGVARSTIYRRTRWGAASSESGPDDGRRQE